MSETTFQTVSVEEIVSSHSLYWESALANLRVGVLDASEDPTGLVLTLSTDLPYRAAFDRYNTHVAGCTACLDTPVWDIGCETGARLAHIAADAMAAQEDLASQN